MTRKVICIILLMIGSTTFAETGVKCTVYSHTFNGDRELEEVLQYQQLDFSLDSARLYETNEIVIPIQEKSISEKNSVEFSISKFEDEINLTATLLESTDKIEVLGVDSNSEKINDTSTYINFQMNNLKVNSYIRNNPKGHLISSVEAYKNGFIPKGTISSIWGSCRVQL